MKTSKWLIVCVLGGGGVLGLLAACSGRRLPPGTPPPEYEPPIVVPWRPETGDAGPGQGPELAPDPVKGLGRSPSTELSLDAGPR
jgi:hypothetical protein